MTGTAYIKIKSTISSFLVNVASVERFFLESLETARKANADDFFFCATNEDDLEWKHLLLVNN